MGWNPAKEAEKAAKKVVDKVIKPATSAAESAIWKLRRESYAKIKEVGNQTEKALHSIEDEVTENIRKVGKEAEETFTEKLPDLFEDFIEEIAESVAKEGLKKTQQLVKGSHRIFKRVEENKPELVDAINELGGKIEIGPMTLAYTGFYTRMEEVIGVLDHYINEPPSIRRRDIIAMIKALGPDSVDLGISIQVVAVVVGSKELGVGGGLNDISIELFAEIADAILEAAGVPE